MGKETNEAFEGWTVDDVPGGVRLTKGDRVLVTTGEAYMSRELLIIRSLESAAATDGQTDAWQRHRAMSEALHMRDVAALAKRKKG